MHKTRLGAAVWKTNTAVCLFVALTNKRGENTSRLLMLPPDYCKVLQPAFLAGFLLLSRVCFLSAARMEGESHVHTPNPLNQPPACFHCRHLLGGQTPHLQPPAPWLSPSSAAQRKPASCPVLTRLDPGQRQSHPRNYTLEL